MKRAVILRLQSMPDRMLGALYIFSGIMRLGKFVTLEPPWKGNAKNESCIPPGDYTLSPRAPTSRFPYPHLILGGTGSREYILMHRGNVPKNTEGCILPGMGFGSADGDKVPDVLQSTAAMNLLVQMIPETIGLRVIDLSGWG